MAQHSHGGIPPRMRRAGLSRCGLPYLVGVGIQRDLRHDAGAFAAWAVDRERALERRDAVGEAAEARSARRVGAADAVVRDLDAQRALLAGDANGHDRGAGVLDHVRERLRDDVVGGGLDRLRQLDVRRLDLDGDGQPRGERLERRRRGRGR